MALVLYVIPKYCLEKKKKKKIVMQFNWLYFCGICQLIPLKLWPNTAQGCNHQSTCMPQLHTVSMFSCSGTQCTTPGGMKARVSPVQWSKPYSILAPTQDSNQGGQIRTRVARFKIISGDHYTLPLHTDSEIYESKQTSIHFRLNLWKHLKYWESEETMKYEFINSLYTTSRLISDQ